MELDLTPQTSVQKAMILLLIASTLLQSCVAQPHYEPVYAETDLCQFLPVNLSENLVTNIQFKSEIILAGLSFITNDNKINAIKFHQMIIEAGYDLTRNQSDEYFIASTVYSMFHPSCSDESNTNLQQLISQIINIMIITRTTEQFQDLCLDNSSGCIDPNNQDISLILPDNFDYTTAVHEILHLIILNRTIDFPIVYNNEVTIYHSEKGFYFSHNLIFPRTKGTIDDLEMITQSDVFGEILIEWLALTKSISLQDQYQTSDIYSGYLLTIFGNWYYYDKGDEEKIYVSDIQDKIILPALRRSAPGGNIKELYQIASTQLISENKLPREFLIFIGACVELFFHPETDLDTYPDWVLYEQGVQNIGSFTTTLITFPDQNNTKPVDFPYPIQLILNYQEAIKLNDREKIEQIKLAMKDYYDIFIFNEDGTITVDYKIIYEKSFEIQE